MRKFTKILWGLVFLVLGTMFVLNAFNITNFTLFFEGWWTLIIIIPCAIGLFTESDKVGNIIGILIGVVLLLCCQDIISFSILRKLIVPAILIFIGLKLIFGAAAGNKASKIINEAEKEGKKPRSSCATFSESKVEYDGEVFESAELNAVFGGVKCDLTKAIIENDCAIQASAIFGGITILVPPNVNVKVNSNSIFGGITNKASSNKGEHTLYISGTCMFGGVDIK